MDLGKKFIKYIKEMPCSVCGNGDVDAHHLEAIGMGNNRKKKNDKDFSCVPLCRIHHSEYHNMGLVAMQDKYRGNRLNLWKDNRNILFYFLMKDEHLE